MSDSMKEETFKLVEDYIHYCLGNEKRPAPSPIARTVRRVAGDMERKNPAVFESIRSYLHCLGSGDGLREPSSVLLRVVGQMELDGNMNWGRLVTLFAFAGVLAKQMDQQQGTETSRSLAEVLSNYIVKEQGKWLESNGGWVGFHHFFEGVKDSQDPTMRNAIMAAAGFGLAGLAFLLVVR